MNASTLKIIGILAMILDHVGWVFFPKIELFHIVGKLAIPIFCYMIAEGYEKTRNVKSYLMRLVGLGIISQVPFLMTFRLCFGESFSGLNTIFDLALGLLTIWLYDKANFKGKGIIVVIGALTGLFAGIDGDYYVVLLIFIFYKYHHDFKKIIIWMGVLTTITSCFFPVYGMIYALTHGVAFQQFIQNINNPEYVAAVSSCLLQIIYLVALVPIKFYNGEKGRNIKLLFYGFYPVHLIILYMIKVFLIG